MKERMKEFLYLLFLSDTFDECDIIRYNVRGFLSQLKKFKARTHTSTIVDPACKLLKCLLNSKLSNLVYEETTDIKTHKTPKKHVHWMQVNFDGVMFL